MSYITINEQSLDRVPSVLAVPEATRTYCPVPQNRLWEQVKGTFEQAGFGVEQSVHQIHKKRPVFVSRATITGDGLPDMPGQSWEFAVMNSYDMTISNRILFGKRVFICSNGVIFADHILRTKHTTNVWSRLPNLIGQAVSQFHEQSESHRRREEVLRNEYTSNEQLAMFGVQLAQRGTLARTMVMDFYEESKQPSFDYGTDPLCLWNLQAAFTHLAKRLNPVTQSRSVLSFEENLNQFYALN